MNSGIALKIKKTLESVAIQTNQTFASTKDRNQHQLEQVSGEVQGTLVQPTSLTDSYIGTMRNKDGVSKT
jgi:hypothetical protein